jgi:hypothetical protein
VTYESINRRQRELRAGEELAAALDAVSGPMAERILGRAIEVDAAREATARHKAETFDYDELLEIAKEVGITEDALRQALLEEFNTDKDHNPKLTERLTLPDEVRGGIIVARSRRELAEVLDRVVERVRSAQAEAVEQRDGRRTLVEVKAKTAPMRRRALILIALFVVLGPALAQLVASIIFLGIAAAAVVGIVAWVKGVGRRIRRRVNRALSELVDDDGEARSWLDVWERSAR